MTLEFRHKRVTDLRGTCDSRTRPDTLRAEAGNSTEEAKYKSDGPKDVGRGPRGRARRRDLAVTSRVVAALRAPSQDVFGRFPGPVSLPIFFLMFNILSQQLYHLIIDYFWEDYTAETIALVRLSPRASETYLLSSDKSSKANRGPSQGLDLRGPHSFHKNHSRSILSSAVLLFTL